MQYVIEQRHVRLFFALGVAICILSVVASASSLWLAYQVKRERSAYEHAAALAEKLMAEAARLGGDTQ